MQRIGLALLQQVWFGGLFVLWATLLFGGFALGRPSAADGRRMPVWTRIASSLVLVLAAWSFYLVDVLFLGRSAGVLGLGIAVGMTLGALGDLFLAGLISAPDRVLAGMAAFGLGHVAYMAGMLAWAAQERLTATPGRWVAWLVWLVLGAVGWYAAVYRGGPCTKRHWLALPYALLLANTVGVAAGLSLQVATFIPLALGAFLFLASDLLLAANLFCALQFPGIHDVIWLTYGPGQMLIVYTPILLLLRQVLNVSAA